MLLFKFRLFLKNWKCLNIKETKIKGRKFSFPLSLLFFFRFVLCIFICSSHSILLCLCSMAFSSFSLPLSQFSLFVSINFGLLHASAYNKGLKISVCYVPPAIDSTNYFPAFQLGSQHVDNRQENRVNRRFFWKRIDARNCYYKLLYWYNYFGENSRFSLKIKSSRFFRLL